MKGLQYTSSCRLAAHPPSQAFSISHWSPTCSEAAGGLYGQIILGKSGHRKAVCHFLIAFLREGVLIVEAMLRIRSCKESFLFSRLNKPNSFSQSCYSPSFSPFFSSFFSELSFPHYLDPFCCPLWLSGRSALAVGDAIFLFRCFFLNALQGSVTCNFRWVPSDHLILCNCYSRCQTHLQ